MLERLRDPCCRGVLGNVVVVEARHHDCADTGRFEQRNIARIERFAFAYARALETDRVSEHGARGLGNRNFTEFHIAFEQAARD